MALAVIDTSSSISKKSRHEKVPSVINYEKLAALVGDPKITLLKKVSAIDAPPDYQSKAVVEVDHKTFMKEYKTVFISELEQRQKHRRITMAGLYGKQNRNRAISSSADRSTAATTMATMTNATTTAGGNQVISTAGATVNKHTAPDNECHVQQGLQKDQENREDDHDIEHHLLKIRKAKIKKQGKIVNVLSRKACAKLDRLLNQMPYERPYEDSMQILHILQNYHPLVRQMPLFQLKELSLTATIERYEDSGVVVFASSGFHIILSGSVKPLSLPYVEFLDETDMTPTALAAMKNEKAKRISAGSGEDLLNNNGQQNADSTNSNNNNSSNGGNNLFSQLLRESPMLGDSRDAPNSHRLPTIAENAANKPKTPSNSSMATSRHVSFGNRSRETAVSAGDDEARLKTSSRQQTADTMDTFEQIEAVRMATFEGSSAGRRSIISSSITLTAGDCFGTLKTRSIDALNESGAMLCRVNEPKTVLLKLSSTSYDRISKALSQRQLDKKVNLISACEGYKFWSRLSLEHLAKCAAWVRFSPGTVLASEGEICPYAGYLLAGECRIARRIYVKEPVKGHEEVQKRKEVIMGSFLPGSSFGEKSLMAGEPMKFTLITVTPCEIAVINEEAIQGLENGVKQLLAQIDATGPGLAASSHAEDDIYTEYIKQESERRWSQFRLKVVNDIINYQGIMPGYGRWSKS